MLFKPGMDNDAKQDERGSQREECSICLDDFESGHPLLQLPCRHLFHPSCIKAWFRGHNFCPLCKFVLTTCAGGDAGAMEPQPAAASAPGEVGNASSADARRMRELLQDAGLDHPLHLRRQASSPRIAAAAARRGSWYRASSGGVALAAQRDHCRAGQALSAL